MSGWVLLQFFEDSVPEEEPENKLLRKLGNKSVEAQDKNYIPHKSHSFQKVEHQLKYGLHYPQASIHNFVKIVVLSEGHQWMEANSRLNFLELLVDTSSYHHSTQ